MCLIEPLCNAGCRCAFVPLDRRSGQALFRRCKDRKSFRIKMAFPSSFLFLFVRCDRASRPASAAAFRAAPSAVRMLILLCMCKPIICHLHSRLIINIWYLKYLKNSRRNVCRFGKSRYLCIRVWDKTTGSFKNSSARPASDTANEMPPISIECKVLEKKLQKVLEFQKSSLPLQPRLRKTKTVLRSVASLRQTDSRRTMPKVGSTQGSWKKSCRKVCKFKKLALPLQSRSRHKRRTVFKLVLWFTGKFWEKRNVVFICQFFKREAK